MTDTQIKAPFTSYEKDGKHIAEYDNQDGTRSVYTLWDDDKGAEATACYLNRNGKDTVITTQFGIGPKDENGDLKTHGLSIEDHMIFAYLRLKLVNAKFPCRENEVTLSCLYSGIASQVNRRLDRGKRDVLNKLEA